MNYRPQLQPFIFALVAWVAPALWVPVLRAGPEESPVPAVGEEAFQPLLANSPFLRIVNAGATMVVTGVGRIGDETFVTVTDTTTGESALVTESANHLGWQLVGLEGEGGDLENLTALLRINGSEVVRIRYLKEVADAGARGRHGNLQGRSGGSGGDSNLSRDDFREARHVAVHYWEGFSSDGYQDPPPRFVIERLKRLNAGQREQINREMITLRKRGLGSDERRRIFDKKVHEALGN